MQQKELKRTEERKRDEVKLRKVAEGMEQKCDEKMKEERPRHSSRGPCRRRSWPRRGGCVRRPGTACSRPRAS